MVIVAAAVMVANLAVVDRAVEAQPFGAPPEGGVDRVFSPRAGRLRVVGWADDNATAPVNVHVYVDDAFVGSALADKPRAAAGAITFKKTVYGLGPGLHRLCAYAVDVAAPIQHRGLGCRTVTVANSNPFGALDRVTSPALATIAVTGWTIDPNIRGPIPVHVYVDGRYAGAALANQPRPDVARAFPPNHERHGYTTRLEGIGYGSHRVCVFGINQRTGDANTRLGCDVVNVMADPSTEPKSELVINGAGDVRADWWWYPAGLGGRRDYSSVFTELGGLFVEDDLTVINLECAASRLGAAVPKNWNFRCDPDLFSPLREAGVDVVSQANNHALDFGVAAMLDGSEQLWSRALPEVGSGRTADDAFEPALFEINGWRVAVIGMAGFVEFDWWLATDDRAGLANGYDVAQMTDAVQRADAHADIVVVAIHWGTEGVTTQNAEQERRGRALIDAGADIIYGHHPHRLQPLEMYDGRPLFYSLGNFGWPVQSDASRDTAVGQVVVSPDGSFTACFLDATIVTAGHPALDDSTTRRC